MAGCEFWIHIGIPKTATTTIQEFLAVNRDRLRARGVLYPRSAAIREGGGEVHRPFGVAIEPECTPWYEEFAQEWMPRDPVGALRDEAESSGCRKIVVSSEDLFFLTKPERLRDALHPHSVSVVVHLRRQDDFLTSFYNQIIKSRLYVERFESFLDQVMRRGRIDLAGVPMDLRMCAYDRLLDVWAAVFGINNIHVSIYGDHVVPGGVIANFAQQVGFDIAGLDIPRRDTNPALPNRLSELKRLVNVMLDDESDRMACEDAFVRFARQAPHRPDASLAQRVADLQRRIDILHHYADGNHRVMRTYFPERSLLFMRPSETDRPLPLTDMRLFEPETPALIASLIHEVARLRQPRTSG